MTKSAVSIGVLVVSILLPMALARAQEPASPAVTAAPATGVQANSASQGASPALPPAQPVGPAKAPSSAAVPPPRDPTVPSADLRTAIDQSGLAPFGPGRPSALKLPEIVLRGRIQVDGKPVRAMIEVGAGGIHIIAAGSQLTVDAGPDKSLVLQVVHLTLEEIEIEIPSLHKKIVIR